MRIIVKILIPIVVAVILLVAYKFMHYNRGSSEITYDNGENQIKIILEFYENTLSISNREITSFLTIDYGDKIVVHKSFNKQFGFELLLIKDEGEVFWCIENVGREFYKKGYRKDIFYLEGRITLSDSADTLLWLVNKNQRFVRLK